jgi:hypothetical protein
MGHLAAHTMTRDLYNETHDIKIYPLLPSPFLLFTHITRFFGYKVHR